jgi:16S rRNA (adenine(1408)-N(1))-methyltransferase
MEILNGKQPVYFGAPALSDRRFSYSRIWIDLGAGDGKFVLESARADPCLLALGVDACRENLHEAARRAPANALFIIANALDLPPELAGLAAQVTVNFPWGSLLAGLLDGDARLLGGLARTGQPGARLEIRLNASALAEVGWELDHGARRVAAVLQNAGVTLEPVRRLEKADLRRFPSTWARRLASGANPQGVLVQGVMPG